MFHIDYNSWLIPYAEGELDPRQAAILEARLKRDADLAAELERTRELVRVLQKTGASDPEPVGDFSIWPRVQSELRSRPRQSLSYPRLTLAFGGAAALAAMAVTVIQPWNHPASRTAPPHMVASVGSPIMPAPAVEPMSQPHSAPVMPKLHEPPRPVVAAEPKSRVPRIDILKPEQNEPTTDVPYRTEMLPPTPLHVASPATDTAVRPVRSFVGSRRVIPAPTATYATAVDIPAASGMKVASVNTGSRMPDLAPRNSVDGLRDRLDATDESVVDPVAALARDVNSRGADSLDGSVVPVLSGGSDAVAPGGRGGFSMPTGSSAKVATGSLMFAGNTHSGSVLLMTHPDSDYPANELRIALQAANRHDVNTALETWRDVLMDQLQAPQYDDLKATDQATDILIAIRKTGNLVPFRAFLQGQVTPVPDELPDWRILGLLYSLQGEYEKAAHTWTYVTAASGAAPEDWYQLAQAREAAGDAAGARAAYTVAVSGLPENSAHRAAAQHALAPLR